MLFNFYEKISNFAATGGDGNCCSAGMGGDGKDVDGRGWKMEMKSAGTGGEDVISVPCQSRNTKYTRKYYRHQQHLGLMRGVTISYRNRLKQTI